MTACSVCAFELTEAYAFCPQCGARLDAQAPKSELLSTQRGLPLPHLVKPSVIKTDELASTQKLHEIKNKAPAANVSTEPADSERATLVALPAVLDEIEKQGTKFGASESAKAVKSQSVKSDQTGDELAGHLMNEKQAGHMAHEPLSESDAFDVPPIRPSNTFRNIGLVLVMTGLFLCSVDFVDSGVKLSFGQASLTNIDGLVRVSVPVEGRGPVLVHYPGGQRSVHGQDNVSFGYDSRKLKLGVQSIQLKAVHEDTEIPVSGHLDLLYRLRLVSFVERTIEMQLDLAPGVAAEVARGQLRSIGGQTFRWSLPLTDADLKQRTIMPAITLQTKNNETHRLEEEIYIPALYTPITILSPTPGYVHSRPKIDVRGYTLPNATVTYGDGQSLRASETGEFRLEVETHSKQMEIPLTVSSDGLRPSETKFGFVVMSGTSRRAELKRLRSSFKRLKRSATRVSNDVELGGERSEKMITFSGLLVARHRTGQNSQALVVNSCKGPKRCPVWVDYDGLDFTTLGRKVNLVGRVIGKRKYTSLDGQTRTVPRFLAEALVP